MLSIIEFVYQNFWIRNDVLNMVEGVQYVEHDCEFGFQGKQVNRPKTEIRRLGFSREKRIK